MRLDEHDRVVAFVLGLSHALNIAFFSALAEAVAALREVVAGGDEAAFAAMMERGRDYLSGRRGERRAGRGTMDSSTRITPGKERL